MNFEQNCHENTKQDSGQISNFGFRFRNRSFIPKSKITLQNRSLWFLSNLVSIHQNSNSPPSIWSESSSLNFSSPTSWFSLGLSEPSTMTEVWNTETQMLTISENKFKKGFRYFFEMSEEEVQKLWDNAPKSKRDDGKHVIDFWGWYKMNFFTSIKIVRAERAFFESPLSELNLEF